MRIYIIHSQSGLIRTRASKDCPDCRTEVHFPDPKNQQGRQTLLARCPKCDKILRVYVTLRDIN